MPKPHFARRIIAILALAAFASGCGRDSTAPENPSFDPAGTNSDMTAIGASFESSAVASYAAASGLIGGYLGDSPAAAAVKAAPSAKLFSGGRAGASRYAAALASSYTGSSRIHSSLSAAPIPEQYLGVTFVFDPETDGYAASDRSGAPQDGVRFALYAINSVTGAPVEPLVEVGHADIVATESVGSASLRITVVSADVTYLDYSVAATGGESTVSVTVSGLATDGTDRVNFDLNTQLSDTALSFDYQLTVPTRGGFRLDIDAQITNADVTVNVEARGAHGTVAISGVVTDGAGALDVEVNGGHFAIITVSANAEPSFAGADGHALTEEELEALRRIVTVVGNGFNVFDDLTAPLS